MAGSTLWKSMLFSVPSPWCLFVLFFLGITYQVLSGKKNNMVVFQFPFNIFVPVAKLRFIRFQR